MIKNADIKTQEKIGASEQVAAGNLGITTGPAGTGVKMPAKTAQNEVTETSAQGETEHRNEVSVHGEQKRPADAANAIAADLGTSTQAPAVHAVPSQGEDGAGMPNAFVVSTPSTVPVKETRGGYGEFLPGNIVPATQPVTKIGAVDPAYAAADNYTDDQLKDMLDTAPSASEESDYQDNAISDADVNNAREAIAASEVGEDIRRRIGNAFGMDVYKDMDKIYRNTPAYNLAKRIMESRDATRPETFSRTRAQNIEKAEKEAQKVAFSNKGRGRRVWEKIVSDARIGVREIGVGYDDMLALVQQNSTMLEALIKENTGIDVSNIESWSVRQMVSFFNKHTIFVATFKPPHNDGPDQQRRIIRVMADQPRGIFMNPIVAPMYTADFDGDDMDISMDPEASRNVKDPMEHILGYDGKLTLKLDWLPLSPLVDGDDMSAREYVRKVMLSAFANLDNAHGIDTFCDAVVALGDSSKMNNEAQEQAWKEMFLAADEVARSVHPDNRNRRNKLSAGMIEAVVSSMRQLKLDGVFAGVVDRESLLDDESLPDIRLYDDYALYDIAAEYVQNRAPNNAQQLKVMLNGFIGYVKGKNPSFRFTADVAKMFKLDSRLRVGGCLTLFDSRTGEYEIDPNNDQHVVLLHEALLRWAESEAMQKEIKKAGHSQYYTDVMRTRVIKKVGFPTDARWKNNYAGFLGAFYNAYNTVAAEVNMANRVSLTTGQIADDSNRGTVSQIILGKDRNGNDRKYPTPSDLAEPMLSIYGTPTVGRMFRPLIEAGIMDPSWFDPNWKGVGGSNLAEQRYHWGSPDETPDQEGLDRVEKRKELIRELKGNQESNAQKTKKRPQRWIDGRYNSLSMRRFAHDNRIISGNFGFIKSAITTPLDFRMIEDEGIGSVTFYDGYDDKAGKPTNPRPMDDQDLMFCMLMAIADKGTGQLSTYNKTMFGVGPKSRAKEKKTDRKSVNEQKQREVNRKDSVIGRVGELLSDIKRLSLQGTVLEPGYYAGIGSRKTPPEVQKAMREVAQILSSDGWRMRSGHAVGADQAFEAGSGEKADIYLPWFSYNSGNQSAIDSRIVGKALVYDDLSGVDQRRARTSVDKYHPAVAKLNTPGKMKLQARNYFQVCGLGDEPDSAFIACWSPNDGKPHGTDQAIRIGKSRGIPVYNAADYENLDDWKRDVLEAAAKAKEHRLVRLETSDQIKWINDIVEVLSHFGPDMFKYFGMDNAYGFLNSKLGQTLIENCDNLEVLGGIWTAMVCEYRMSEINALQRKMQNMISAGKATKDTLHDYEQRIEFAISELSGSSEVWSGIIKELQAEATPGMTSVFAAKRNSGKPQSWPAQTGAYYKATDGTYRARQYEWNPKYVDAKDFWTPAKGSKSRFVLDNYPTLLSVLQDFEMDRETKWNIIADVVRYWENDLGFKSYAVGFQLDIGNSAAYSANPADKKSVLGIARDFNSAFNSWSKVSQEKLQYNIDNAYKFWGGVKGSLISTLQHLDECPWDLVTIDDGMYADALMASFDKTYADSEKGQSHPWANLIHNALAAQWNGGLMNDVTRCDDRLLGITAAKSIDVHDIIHLLNDGNASLTIYNQYGQYAVLNRALLLEEHLGHPVDDNDQEALEQAIWQFLREEPRIAAAIRTHNACALSNSDGDGYVGARLSTAQTIRNFSSLSDPIAHIKYLMRDHPVYGAIIVASAPGHGAVARKHRERMMKIEDYFVKLIYQYAIVGVKDAPLDWSGNPDSSWAARRILESIGITQKSINNAMMSDYDRFRKLANLPVTVGEGGHGRSEAAENALFTYIVMYRNLAAYIETVQKSGVRRDPNKNYVPTVPEGIKFGPDVESVAAFWDVCQELGGAKTATSTGVEGAETYEYGLWSQTISKKDIYTSLKAVEDDIDESWAGCWTNLVNQDKTPVLLKFDDQGPYVEIIAENGTATVYRDLEEARRSQNLNEIVVRPPNEYRIRDKTIDRNGNQVPTLNAYMVIKRSRGAEEFNLQAKKAGLDGKDSIIKMHGKYRKDESGIGNVDFISLRNQLRQIAEEFSQPGPGMIDENGLLHAKLALSKMLLDENFKFKYRSMTLSDYMNIADLMLFIGDDGNLYLRSLEMLMSAARYRVGPEAGNMSDDKFAEAVRNIVADTSETAVGRAQMNPLEALDDFTPKGKAGAVNGIRTKMVSFERNFNLLENILEKENVDMLPDDQAMQFDKLLRSTPGIGAPSGSGDDELPGVLERAAIMRSYNIVRCAGATTKFSTNGRTDYGAMVAPGFANAMVIGDGVTDIKTVSEIFEAAHKYGNTVIVSRLNLDLIPDKWRDDMVTCSDVGDMMISFFDVMLNGCEAEPYRGKRFNPVPTPDTSYGAFVEAEVDEWGLGDSEMKVTRHFTDNVHNIETGSKRIDAGTLFPNVFNNPAYKNCSFRIMTTSGRAVANALTTASKKVRIDYGMLKSHGESYQQRKKDVDDAIDRYIDNITLTDNRGFLLDQVCRPGDIVGWMRLDAVDVYTGARIATVLAPVIPFQLDGVKKGVPAEYKVAQVTRNDGTIDDDSWLSIDWSNTTPVEGHIAKMHSPSGAADKGMVNFGNIIEDLRRFLDGTPVSGYIAKASIDSRRNGTDRRIKTMVSAITLLRLHGVNFANAKGAFPDNPEIKERLLRECIPASEWKNWMSFGKPLRFSDDPDINLFLNVEIRKVLFDGGNPSDYLANVFTDENGVEHRTHMMWEFEAMFEPGLNYEDSFLKFMHACDEGFCPNGLDDDGEGYLFRLAKDGGVLARGYNRGVLQMKAPFRNNGNSAYKGKTGYIWSTVYIGQPFFGEDYSGFSRPNVDGASRFLDAAYTQGYGMMKYNEHEEKLRRLWAVSDQGHAPRGANAISWDEESNGETDSDEETR